MYFILHKNYTDNKYQKAEEEFGLTTDEKVFFRTNGNFNLCNKVMNCNIYFCEDRIVFLCLRKGKITSEEIPVSLIEKVSSDSVTRVLITTSDNRVYAITTPDARALSEALQDKPYWLNK
ncbi:MAG: hypothetical protein E7563_03875 [Ruminococcaceae bacterium]|nr:hypothetical protein [Oscillospiraceae bacterium]